MKVICCLFFRFFLIGCVLFPSVDAFGQKHSKTYLTLSFIGDVMQHGPQIRSAYRSDTDSYDYYPCFRYIAPSIRSSDITIANLELTLAGEPYKGYPAFSAPDELAVAMKQAGIDVFVTANNHSLDRRKKGLERTIDVLDSLNIPYTGTFKDAAERANAYPKIIERKGIEVALLNYTYATNGIPTTHPNIVNRMDTSQIKIDLEKAKSLNPDVIITFMHWGYQYKLLPNKEQKDLAQFCKAYGADLVIGSHPHVLQPIELSNDRSHLTVFSLGNFVSNQRTRYRDGGMIVTTTLEIDTLARNTKIAEAGYHLTWVHKKSTSGGNEYYILPAAAYAYDTTLITNKADREKLATFLTDSRSHLTGHNKGDIAEYYHQIDYVPHYNREGELIYKEPRQAHPVIAASFDQTEKTGVKDRNKTEKEASVNERNEYASLSEKRNTDNAAKASSNGTTKIYRIQFFVSSQGIDTSALPKQLFRQVYTEKVDGNTRYLTGTFTKETEARKHLAKIRSTTRFKDAYVVSRELVD